MKMNECSFSKDCQRALALLACAALLISSGCSSKGTSVPPGTTTINSGAANAGNFSTTVFLGDSLTAGYQNGSLLDTQQPHGWAPLFATQAAFTITQPLIAPPGAPAVLQLVSFGPPPVVQQTPTSSTYLPKRDNPSVQATDLAVPGALVNDVENTVPMVIPTTQQQYITQLVLGYPGIANGVTDSQSQFAILAKPTTIFLWIGSNDALNADFSGVTTSLTSTADFTTQFQQLMVDLTNKTTAHLLIGNIPDVTLVPYLTPAALVLAEASAQTGQPVAALSAVLGIQAGDLVNATGLGEVPKILSGSQKGPIDDAGFLTPAEIATIQAQVVAYNQVIAAQATAAGATLVDINALFAQTAAKGLTVGGYTAQFSFLGGIFGLDGIHPTNTGYGLLANTFIDASNSANGTKIPDVDLATIAATDPLWPPNFPRPAIARMPTHISAEAGKAAEMVLSHGARLSSSR